MNIKNIKNTILSEDIQRIVGEQLPWDELRDTTFLVTGASGMIPSYVVFALLGLNDVLGLNITVLALVRNEAKAQRVFAEFLDRDDLKLLVQDVTSELNIAGKVDYIIHGASAARPVQHRTAPTATLKANLLGTFNLLDFAVNAGTKAFMIMSSSEVYGQVDKALTTITESDYGYLDCLNPRSCYSEGKRAAETICSSYNAQYGIDCKIARFAHIYGPGLALDDGRVQAEFASKVFHGENIVMNSDGSSQRAYTYVSDAVAGMFYILLKGDEMAYNIADSDNVISIRQLAEAFIASRPEKNLELIMNIDKEAAKMYNPAAFIGLDNKKILGLGWSPRVGVSEGTKRMISHYEITE